MNTHYDDYTAPPTLDARLVRVEASFGGAILSVSIEDRDPIDLFTEIPAPLIYRLIGAGVILYLNPNWTVTAIAYIAEAA